MDEELHSTLNDVELEEKEPHEQIRLECVVKRYKYGKTTMRSIGISGRFNAKAEIEKYDRATEKGRRYCIVAIRFVPVK